MLSTMRPAQHHHPFQYPQRDDAGDTETLGSRRPESSYTSLSTATRPDSTYTTQEYDSYYARDQDSTFGGDSARASAFSALSNTNPFQYANYESRQSMSTMRSRSSVGPSSQEPTQAYTDLSSYYEPTETYDRGDIQVSHSQESSTATITPVAVELPASPSSTAPESPSSTRSNRVRSNTTASRNFSRPFNYNQPNEPLPPAEAQRQPSLNSLRSAPDHRMMRSTSNSSNTSRNQPEIVILERERNRPVHPGQSGFTRSISDASTRSLAHSEPYFHRPPLTPSTSDYAKSDYQGPSGSPDRELTEHTSPTRKPNKLRRKPSKASISIKRSYSAKSARDEPHSPTESDALSTMSKRSSKWKSFFGMGKRESTDTQHSQHWRDSVPVADVAPPEIVFSPPTLTDMEAEKDWETMQRRHEEQERAEEERRRQAYEQQAQLHSSIHPSRSREEDDIEDLALPDHVIEKKKSTNSVYSAYSIYSLPDEGERSRQSSPTQSRSPSQANSPIIPQASRTPAQANAHTAVAKTKLSIANLQPPPASPSKRRDESEASILSPDQPMDCLLLGIEQHESGDLSRAAYFFERSAKIEGGVGPGMLLWGLTLLHGWGVVQDEAKGFAWLQRAAESVVEDLDVAVREGKVHEKENEAKFELVLAVYELGMCFRRGWGVKKDKKMALSYFELAANLGDADAQNELAFCYLNGKGCKRDKKKAAKYYRMAAANGTQMEWGMHWIWKSKNDDESKT